MRGVSLHIHSVVLLLIPRLCWAMLPQSVLMLRVLLLLPPLLCSIVMLHVTESPHLWLIAPGVRLPTLPS